MGSSGSSGGGGTYTMRYASYIESQHKKFLSATLSYRQSACANNPYLGYTDIPIDVGFFGAGKALKDFDSLFELEKSYILDTDVNTMWKDSVVNTSDINNVVLKNLVASESEILDEELNSNILPKFMTGMRDINATLSSTFINGKGLLLNSKQKQLAKYSSELQWKLINIGHDRFKTNLAWKDGVVARHIDVLKTYFTITQAITDFNYSIIRKYRLWRLDVLDYERANLGALQGAMKQTSDQSSGTNFLGGALSGAAAGGMIAGPLGAFGGAVLGGVASLF